MAEVFQEFANRVLTAFQTENLEELEKCYTELSEESNINKAKRICAKLHLFCYDHMTDTVKNERGEKQMKYYAWHFLQLMTCCVEVKSLVEKDAHILPALININSQSFGDQVKEESLKSVTLNYIVFMLGEATNAYYDHFADAKVIPYLYETLSNCTLSQDDKYVESLILALNLLLEGTSNCKQQLIELEFAKLVMKKIHERTNCSEELLKVAHLTYQKLLLLTSDQQSFVETFRKGFSEESKKQALYQPVKCFNRNCSNLNVASYKRCSRCKLTTYCSRECQIAHWKSEHKKACTLTS